jgi:hypothetical protein
MLEPSRPGRRDLEPQDTWKRQSPPELGGRVQSRGTRGSTEALPRREAGSGAVERVAVCGCTPCFLPVPGACTRGYPAGAPHAILPEPNRKVTAAERDAVPG